MTTNPLISEILEQPEALRRVYQAYVAQQNEPLWAAAALLRAAPIIYMTGMVTSEYASYAAASLLNQAGCPTVVQDASEFLYYHYHADSFPRNACFVVVSQSGESAEIVHLLQKLNGRSPVIGVFNNEDSYLANHCDVPLPIYAGPQHACGSKTNLSTIAVLLLLAEAALVGKSVAAAGAQLLKVVESLDRLNDGWQATVEPIADFLEGASYTAFLGRGFSLASALFSAVLFKEVPKLVAEGMSAAAFRHGMLEMIRPEHRIVLFAPAGVTHDLALGLAETVLDLDIPLLLVTNRDVELAPRDHLRLVRTPAHDEAWAPLVDMVPLQMTGYELARRRGLEPGVLQIASYVTTIE